MENRGYSIYEVGILKGNDQVKTNLFVLVVLYCYNKAILLMIFIGGYKICNQI